MGHSDDKGYRLQIRKDGHVLYLMSDGAFWHPRNCPHLEMYIFKSRTDAELFWHSYTQSYPVFCRDWIPKWEEI